MNKLIILDRDGVINQDSLQYIKSTDELIFLPSSIESITKLSNTGYKIAIATNQSGISRGLYTEEQLNAIHSKLLNTVRDAGGNIDCILYCPHLPEQNCTCRKPQPGMLLNIGKHFNAELSGVPFVGDRVSDIKAAFAAGADPIIVYSPMTNTQELDEYPNVPRFSSLKEYVDVLLES